MRESDDPWVVVWEGASLEGDMIAGALERALVPVSRDAGLVAGQMRIEVPRSYQKEAAQLIESGDFIPDTAEEFFGEPRQPGAMSLLHSRYVLAAVALLIVLAILLTSRY